MSDLIDYMASSLAVQHGPLAQRLQNAVVASIDDGVIKPGEAFPAERILSDKLGVSRSTLRQSLKELVDRGLLQTRQGVGTVVTGRVAKALSRLSGFSEDMQLRGLLPDSKILGLNIGQVTADCAFRTGLPLGTRTLTLERLRLAGGQAMSYEIAIVPVDCVGEDYDGSGSLYERMDENGRRPRRVLQSLEATEASAEIADLLNTNAGAAVLKISQVGYDKNGLAVEDAVSWFRGDKYKYVGEIRG